jgi:hypothetical protein
MILKHEFVDYLPENVEDGTIYLAMSFGAVVHNCCCGCGNKVFTPLTPTDWKLTYDGESISLFPSIGNWGFDCQSHYWIEESVVLWSSHWSKNQIEAGRANDAANKRDYFGSTEEPVEPIVSPTIEVTNQPVDTKIESGLWNTIRKWFLK